jgi:NAD(P)-dependent dehydrogenase (short-subunit alcohol dehydrogenase family)
VSASAPVVAITDVSDVGRAIALELAARGCRIALYHPRLSTPQAEPLVHELGAAQAYAHPVEIEGWDELVVALRATAAAFGEPPRHAVIYYDHFDDGGGGPLHLGPEDRGHYRRTITHNLEAVYRAFRAVLPAMVAAASGSIVMIGSYLAEAPHAAAGAALHGAAKAAGLALAQAAAQEVVGLGVRVNSILITAADTAGMRSMLPNLAPGMWTAPASIAKLVAFLVSDDARDVTGATIPLFGRAGVPA